MRRSPVLVLWVPFLLAAMLFKSVRYARKYDVIQANWAVCGAIAAIAARFNDCKVVTTLRGDDVNKNPCAQGSATFKQVVEPRPAHKGYVQSVPAADLLHGGAKQDHHVGGGQAAAGLECEFALARSEFHFHGAQRQAQRAEISTDDFERRLKRVQALFGQILKAVSQKGNIRRSGGLSGIFRLHLNHITS